MRVIEKTCLSRTRPGVLCAAISLFPIAIHGDVGDDIEYHPDKSLCNNGSISGDYNTRLGRRTSRSPLHSIFGNHIEARSLLFLLRT